MLGLRSRVYRHVAFASVRGVSRTSYQPVRKPAQPSTVKNNRKPGSYILLGLAGIIGFYVTSLGVAIAKATSDSSTTELSQQKDVAARYDEIADSFDSDVNMSEWIMGILTLRKRIANMCSGNVLEVSCGTGRNLGYFVLDAPDKKIKSLTLIDLSPQMVEVCKKKFLTLRAASKVKDTKGNTKQKITQGNNIEVQFIAGSALQDMPLAPDGNKYDTIVQTMGLCSTTAPAELVINMARHLNLQNPDARIYLLEHGRSTYDWLNKILDSSAQKHADAYGCWYNRDLDGIIGEAVAKSGLEVVREKRHDAGTTYIYELKAGPDTAAKLEKLASSDMIAESALSIWSRWFNKKDVATTDG